ncbi:MAG: ABC transporter permease [Candidatus Bilamarchaeaceae archaeon]
MNIPDMVFYSVNALRYSKLRSWLTVLGIVIGISAIVVLVGLVQGLKNDIIAELSAFGSDTIIITPISTTRGAVGMASMAFMPTKGRMFMTDYERVKRIGGIDYITPVILSRTTVRYKDEENSVSVIGAEPDAFSHIVSSIEIEKGRFLTSSDRRAVVIGNNIARERFENDMDISSTVYIAERRYTVVGVLKKAGTSFVNFDDMIILPFEEAQEIFSDALGEDEITGIRLKVKEGENVEEIAEEINSALLGAHHITEDEKDFSIVTPKFINERLDAMTSTLSLFLSAIAGISLLVGGVGISNTMFMAVLERTREIGILKAVGATEWEIQKLFLVESALIGAFGGFIGLCIAFLLIQLFVAFGISAVFIPWVAVAALLFSACIGMAAGFFPARQAAALDPVEALRYE